MNTQREAEDFIKKIQENSKKNSANEIFFNLYKSKIERISSNTQFKKYNDSNSMNSLPNNSGTSNYKNFNSKK